MNILALVLIVVGEFFYILAEMVGAKSYSQHQTFLPIFLKSFLLIIFAGGLVLAGYIFGYTHLKKNIWVISAVSITSILILEPIIAYLIFKQNPTTGALIGLILGGMGFMAALFL